MLKKDNNIINVKFCVYCGTQIEKGKKICPKCGKLATIKSNKYMYTKTQLKIVKQRVLPTLIVGFVIWLITGLYYSGYNTGVSIKLGINIYFLLFILNIILYFITYFISRARKNYIGIITFYLFSFINGIFFSLLLIQTASGLDTEYLKYIYFLIALFLGLFTTAIGYMGSLGSSRSIDTRFYAPIDLLLHVSFFGFGILFVYLIYIFFLEIFIATRILFLIALIIFIYAGIIDINNKSLMASHLKEDEWVFWSFNIFIVLIVIINGIFLIFH